MSTTPAPQEKEENRPDLVKTVLADLGVQHIEPEAVRLLQIFVQQKMAEQRKVR